MSDPVFVLTLVALLGSALLAGLFYAFSVAVMGALGRLPAARGASAMQSINVAILNPVFMASFMGTTMVCAVLALISFPTTRRSTSWLAACFTSSARIVTIAFNVPRNNELAAVEANSAEAADVWRRYLREWTAWNHVRTVAPLAGTASLALALYVG